MLPLSYRIYLVAWYYHLLVLHTSTQYLEVPSTVHTVHLAHTNTVRRKDPFALKIIQKCHETGTKIFNSKMTKKERKQT